MEHNRQQAPSARRVSGHGDVALVVWDHGGTGPALLLTHCNGGCGRLWDPLVPRLARRFHVYALDHRGHGASEIPPNPEAYSWKIQGLDILAALDGLEVTTPVFGAGHSSGAAFLLESEAQRQGTFSGLVLFDPIVGTVFGPEVRLPLAERARHRRDRFEDRQSAREYLGAKPPMETWDPRVLDNFVAHGLRETEDGAVAPCCPGAVEAMVYEGSGSAELEAALRRIACRSLVVGGSDPFVEDAARAAAARMPNAEFRHLPGVSHFIPQERPEECAALILSFLSDLGQSIEKSVGNG